MKIFPAWVLTVLTDCPRVADLCTAQHRQSERGNIKSGVTGWGSSSTKHLGMLAENISILTPRGKPKWVWFKHISLRRILRIQTPLHKILDAPLKGTNLTWATFTGILYTSSPTPNPKAVPHPWNSWNLNLKSYGEHPQLFHMAVSPLQGQVVE